MLTPSQRRLKRVFDIVLSLTGIVLTLPIMVLAWIVATIDTKSNGLFVQERIGEEGKPFHVFKIKTMRSINGLESTVTTSSDQRVTSSGKVLRKTKIDELPQLFNILMGQMSFVGPRPDVRGFADMLTGKDREILSLKPGITGPATLKYKDEERLLGQQADPEHYNKTVIWPDKVAINRQYIKEWSMKKDIFYIIKTVLG
jgi:lipopolysaccharide/colanic/teichoic acid biosynthesis glycosyltransferase